MLSLSRITSTCPNGLIRLFYQTSQYPFSFPAGLFTDFHGFTHHCLHFSCCCYCGGCFLRRSVTFSLRWDISLTSQSHNLFVCCLASSGLSASFMPFFCLLLAFSLIIRLASCRFFIFLPPPCLPVLISFFLLGLILPLDTLISLILFYQLSHLHFFYFKLSTPTCLPCPLLLLSLSSTSERVLPPAFPSEAECAGASEGAGAGGVRRGYCCGGSDPQQQALHRQSWYGHAQWSWLSHLASDTGHRFFFTKFGMSTIPCLWCKRMLQPVATKKQPFHQQVSGCRQIRAWSVWDHLQ